MNTVKDELSKMQQFAQIGKQFNNSDLEHLDASMGAYNYIRMANFIAKHMRKNIGVADLKNVPFLDWGAGYGQVTWLLRNRGINAQGYNVEERGHVEAISELASLPMTCHGDQVKIPFADESFGAVSSCGVLEHVQSDADSLKEIYRILKPGGYFYIFMLPQKTAWVEKLAEKRGISVHPVKYTVKQTRDLLTKSGFEVEKLWRFNLLPKNLTGMPKSMKHIYGHFYRLVYPFDNLLSKIPFLNLLSGVIEGVARKV
ncbi:MAG: class I SAM-dependent methyltransferase [Candidatus Gracilibacteria bacterium]